VKRRFRLTRSADLKRVRHTGKSYAHPLVVLYVTASSQVTVRVAVTAGRGTGNAVRRNRAKRLLRAAMHDLLPDVNPGVDLLLIARSPLPGADLLQVKRALSSVLTRAGLLPPSGNV
jgi:ribonuclease P protein component